MQATIWGCRGTLATPGAATTRYGGNTSCVEVRTDGGNVLVLDAGTGIRGLGETLAGVPHVDLLLTHLHLDHLEGLGFFAPLHDAACAVTIWGPPGVRAGVETWLAPPFYPAPIEAAVDFREVQDESWSLDGLRVTCATVSHPGATLGYRLEADGRVLAYVPDDEAGRDPSPAIELAHAADVLLHDAQYSDYEYRGRVGWGHSSVSDFGRVVEAAAPGRALMFHHDPTRADRALEQLREQAAATLDREIELAYERQVL